MTCLECNHLQREDVRLACAQTPELFFDLPVPFQLAKEQKKNYANLYRNTINDGDSQTSPLPIFPEGVGTSVHRLKAPLFSYCGLMNNKAIKVNLVKGS